MFRVNIFNYNVAFNLFAFLCNPSGNKNVIDDRLISLGYIKWKKERFLLVIKVVIDVKKLVLETSLEYERKKFKKG